MKSSTCSASCSYHSLVKSIQTIPGISNHDGIILTNIALKDKSPRNHPCKTMPIWSKADWDVLKEKSRSLCFDFLASHGTIKRPTKTGKHLVTTCKTSGSQFHPRRPAQNITSPGYRPISNTCAAGRGDCAEKPGAQKTIGQNSTVTMQEATPTALWKAYWEYVNSIPLDDLVNGNNKSFWSYIKA